MTTKLPRRGVRRETRKVLNNESVAISSYSGKTRWQSGEGKSKSAVENRILELLEEYNTIRRQQRETFASLPAQHFRNTRDIKENTDSLTEIEQCKNFIFVIKYEDPYEVWSNFSIKYKGMIYDYDTYRLNNDGFFVCNSPDDLNQQRWRNVTVQYKHKMPYKHCNMSVDSFYHENYTVFKDFNVLFKPTSQNFTREDYGVISGYFSICSAKISLSCNSYLIKVKYSEQYNVFNDFSLTYNNRKYDYRDYRINNNVIEMCASNHTTVLHLWKTRNLLEKSGLLRPLGCDFILKKRFYIVNKQFTLYVSANRQYFTRHEYDVIDDLPVVCKESLKPSSYQYTKEDLLMCNDSIINIKYDDEYKVWNNLSILYKNKMYSYSEYRALNDSIKICNSTNNFVKNIWKLRNYWLMGFGQLKSCNYDYLILSKHAFIVDKQFTVYHRRGSQYLTRHDYGVRWSMVKDFILLMYAKNKIRLKLFHIHTNLPLCKIWKYWLMAVRQ